MCHGMYCLLVIILLDWAPSPRVPPAVSSARDVKHCRSTACHRAFSLSPEDADGKQHPSANDI